MPQLLDSIRLANCSATGGLFAQLNCRILESSFRPFVHGQTPPANDAGAVTFQQRTVRRKAGKYVVGDFKELDGL